MEKNSQTTWYHPVLLSSSTSAPSTQAQVDIPGYNSAGRILISVVLQLGTTSYHSKSMESINHTIRQSESCWGSYSRLNEPPAGMQPCLHPYFKRTLWWCIDWRHLAGMGVPNTHSAHAQCKCTGHASKSCQLKFIESINPDGGGLDWQIWWISIILKNRASESSPSGQPALNKAKFK